MRAATTPLLWLSALLPLACATTITDIQGPAFRSPLEGQTVQNVTGIVTAKSPTVSGFFIQGAPSNDARVSHGLFVFSTSSKVLDAFAVGDEVALAGKVQDFRSASDPTFLEATELASPANVTVLSHNNSVAPRVLDGALSPPTRRFSALDAGPDGFLSFPNNVSQIDVVNATLQPAQFAIDFWASLEGQLVTVPKPMAIGFQNSFGEFFVRGAWPADNINSRGGLTLALGPDGKPDGGPESVIIGEPLDGSNNPNVSVGMTFNDITGVVFYQFGFYYVMPFTAPTIKTTPNPNVPITTLTSVHDGCTVTLGDYNVDNMAPNSTTLPQAAGDIAKHLQSPDIMFMQEIQDNSGPTDDGTVAADVTLRTLAASIAAQGGIAYNFTEVVSVNDQDGGEPGGNIRPAYLFNPRKVALVPGIPVGGPLDGVAPVLKGGKLSLNFNPGRIDPNNSAWDFSRKPIVAAWETTSGARFFTINLHNAAKVSGGSTTEGDARPPLNGAVEQRIAQIKVLATFIEGLLKLDPHAPLIIAGDFNEFVQTRTVFAPFAGLVSEVDALANIPVLERYTYVFDNLQEQLDHMFVSPAVAARRVEVEHVHVNSWAPNVNTRTSDHDPSVARVRVC
ncbi:DNase I-like protein [Phanerochaete sordida]|uniref:DNase I-like protein n=1 Tax=Phanerochaete sordida TaxID=48140 RepID=A0A9P3LAK0_9APHY|nr:DNase I-like protein [Phanerochaete sordida]